jgi:ABC-type cobalamin transport system ATPase subunit
LLLARGHFHRVEGILEVLRETGTSARTAAEQRCFAEPYQKILSLHEAARVQLARLDAAARSGDTLTFDLELERLVSLRRAADGEFQRVRVCFGAR